MSDEDNIANSFVWGGILDERFDCVVVRTNKAYKGRLTVTDKQTNKTIIDEQVELMYGARFGPDISDVQQWETRIMDFIDLEYNK